MYAWSIWEGSITICRQRSVIGKERAVIKKWGQFESKSDRILEIAAFRQAKNIYSLSYKAWNQANCGDNSLMTLVTGEHPTATSIFWTRLIFPRPTTSDTIDRASRQNGKNLSIISLQTPRHSAVQINFRDDAQFATGATFKISKYIYWAFGEKWTTAKCW